MRAVIGHRFGGIECLGLEETSSPALPAGMVHIAVRAAGVSFANLLFIAGRRPNRPELPLIPGTEIAGTVTEIAPDVQNGLRVGDRVCAGLPSGGFAEEAVVDSDNVFAIPDALDSAAATLFPTIYATAYAGLVWRAALAPDEVLLVHGAAGASGLAAVEIGRAVGARVIATAGGARKLETARRHGADHAIDYRAHDFRAAVLEHHRRTRRRRHCFDPVGGDVFDQSPLRCVGPLRAVCLPIGFASEARVPGDPGQPRCWSRTSP